MYCIANKDKFYTGDNISDLVMSVFSWKYKEDGVTPVIMCDGFKDWEIHSYSSAWTEDEKRKDIINLIKGSVKQFGYKIYKEIS